MKTIIWNSKKMQATSELKEYLDDLLKEYDILHVIPTYYLGGLGPGLIQKAIIIVKDKQLNK